MTIVSSARGVGRTSEHLNNDYPESLSRRQQVARAKGNVREHGQQFRKDLSTHHLG